MIRSKLARACGVAVGLALATSAGATRAHAADTPNAVAHETWRAALSRLTLPSGGCFKATFPQASWTRTACMVAPKTRYLPRHGMTGGAANAAGGQTVGDGADYAAAVKTFISQGVGSFPAVTGVKTEQDGGANVYSLQLNSNFFKTTVCNGASNPSSCLGWQQFVYSSSSHAVFMQYWLIHYGNKCPSGGWMSFSGDCYRNSTAVSAPQEPITQLATLSVTGTAKANGTDTMIFTTASKAYTTTGKDTVVNLANGWKQSEYNVVGDGDGSEATFNTGSSITVKIALTDGATTAPKCKANDGTTGETNNLNLGACTTSSGATPSISFIESN